MQNLGDGLRAAVILNSWFVVPAQPVVATPSNELIGQYFPGRSGSDWLHSVKT